jgi:hypothetical protein
MTTAGVPPQPERPTPWRTFLRAHWGVIADADFFTTEVWTWRGLVRYYSVFVINLGRDGICWGSRSNNSATPLTLSVPQVRVIETAIPSFDEPIGVSTS